jgi:DNA mismatch endonuclease, patch repair protein
MSQSWASSAATRASMLANRSRDTGPELAVRRRIHAMGLRYRVNARRVPTLRRTADLVFTRKRVAVFVDGCFWHGCLGHHSQPRANADFWRVEGAAATARVTPRPTKR